MGGKRRIGDDQPGTEIVCAVEYDIGTCDQGRCGRIIEADHVRASVHMGVDGTSAVGRGLRL